MQSNEVYEGEVVAETTAIEKVPTDQVPMFQREEIDMQIATAKKYPRSITAFKREVLEMATLDQATARSMYYVLPGRKKKSEDGKKEEPIEGPSIRFAEICVSAWGNVRYATRGAGVEATATIGEGVCYDLQKNIAASVQVRRRIITKYGQRYGEDMITVTTNAACAIAGRNAIFKIIPFGLVKDIYQKAKEVSLGKSGTMEQKRANCISLFAGLGAKESDVLSMMDRKGVADLSVDDLIQLNGIYTAIKDGEITLAAALNRGEEPNGKEAPKSKSDALAEQLGAKKPEEPKAQEAPTERDQLLLKIEAFLAEHAPEKDKAAELINLYFNVRTWADVTALSLDKLQVGYKAMVDAGNCEPEPKATKKSTKGKLFGE
jgi:hypothetical protein